MDGMLITCMRNADTDVGNADLRGGDADNFPAKAKSEAEAAEKARQEVAPYCIILRASSALPGTDMRYAVSSYAPAMRRP
eukprot:3197851-Rhodomonas_salina.1